MDLPRATDGLPGIGGHLDGTPEHFLVDEIPLYPPTGEGDHWFIRIRKRDLGTPEARQLLADAAGIKPRDVGFAGRKDRHAVTTQMFSLPVEPIQPDDPRIEILERERHRHKLRMGHLAGNRFTIRLTGVHPETTDRLPALLDALEGGYPNYFGEQRFGRDGRALRQARDLLRNPRRRVRDPRFLASVFQSAVFNDWLAARLQDGLLHTALAGDVMRKRATGGLFDCADPKVDQPRIASGEIDPTGPLPGPKARRAHEEAAEREAAVLATWDLDTATSLATLGRFAPGDRRPARVVPGELEVHLEGEDLVTSFVLPKGTYATVLLAELSRPEIHTPPSTP